jgi:hypothetical protein
MNNSRQRICTRTITTRLSDSLFLHIKSQDKPSEYVRELIARDLSQVVSHVKT